MSYAVNACSFRYAYCHTPFGGARYGMDLKVARWIRSYSIVSYLKTLLTTRTRSLHPLVYKSRCPLPSWSNPLQISAQPQRVAPLLMKQEIQCRLYPPAASPAAPQILTTEEGWSSSSSLHKSNHQATCPLQLLRTAPHPYRSPF